MSTDEAHQKAHAMHPALERAYKIGVAIKGFDGTVELLGGLFLWFMPQTLHHWLTLLSTELRETPTISFLASHVDKTNADLAHGTLFIAIPFLVSHGLIKLVLVYCLLREILRAYPYALAILGLFLVYQVYLFIGKPTFGMGLFVVLDALIIWLVWREWRVLKSEQAQKPAEA